MRALLSRTESSHDDDLRARGAMASRSQRSRPSQLMSARAGTRWMQPKCSCGGGCARCQRPSRTISAPGDRYEQEAYRVADRITRVPPSRATTAALVSSRKQATETSVGRPLAPSARSFFETRFGADFSAVRIHDDRSAAVSARALDANAFTVGNDISFAAGVYAPEAPAGRRILAHELAHVIQQRETGNGTWIQRTPQVFGPATGAPSDWSTRVSSASTSSERVALVEEATGARVRNVTDSARNDVRVNVNRLIPYNATTHAINYDDNLNLKRSRHGRDLSQVAGHTVNDETSYIILGPKSLKPGDFFWSRLILSHELDHVRQQQAGSTLQGNESELDAWTSSFMRDFHRSYQLGKLTSTCSVQTIQQWGPLLEYYVRDDVSQSVKEDAVSRISDYYRSVVEPHPAHKLVFRFWIHRTLKKVQPERFRALARDLNSALNLGVDPAADLAATRQFACAGLESLRFEQPTVAYGPGRPDAASPRTGRTLAPELLGGGTLDANARSAAVGIGLRYSLRPSRAIIWNPILGAHVLYLPPGGDREAHVAAAILEAGLRIQQPVEGFYFDVRAGAFAGFRTREPGEDEDVYLQGGVTGSLGAGYRIGDFELGVSVRDLLGLSAPGRNDVMIFGVGAYRF